MKEKSTFIVLVLGLILTMGILILANNLYKLNTSVEESYERIENLDLLESRMEEKFANLKNRLPKEDLDQFIWATTAELNRVEDLLNKMDELETVYGVITGINRVNPMSLDVSLTRLDTKGNYSETKEKMKITLAEKYTPYMAGQLTLAPIPKGEFIDAIEKNLKNDLQEGFTFKTIGGKAVQIYQGYIN